MIEEIVVMDRESVLYYCQRHQVQESCIILITNRWGRNPDLRRTKENMVRDVLYLKMGDTDTIRQGCITHGQAQDIARFVFSLQHSPASWLLIVHCDAGISRSAGVAGGIAKFLFDNDRVYFDTRTHYVPNMRCYHAVLAALHEVQSTFNQSEPLSIADNEEVKHYVNAVFPLQETDS